MRDASKKCGGKIKNRTSGASCALFVQEANRFSSEILLEKDGKKVNAKSIMGLMSQALSPRTKINIIADGDDEENAISFLSDFIQKEG